MRVKTHSLTKLLQNLRDRTARKLQKQHTELSQCADREQLRICGDLLQANLYRIERGASFANVENYYDENGGTLRIKLNPAISPAANAQKYYKDYQKAKNAESFLTDQLKKGESELEELADGFYGIYFPKKKFKDKKYKITTLYQDGTSVTTADCYAFDGQISDYDVYLFAEGKNYDIYEKLGAHPMTIDGVKGTYFAVWAPHARRVSVVGSFNMWDGNLHPMQLHPASGIYELFIPDVEPGAIYKYQILTREGDILYKADPYGNYNQIRPENASIVADISSYKWTDTKWIEERNRVSRVQRMKSPIS
ncbi:MAG: NFACT family protein, partial [Ruminococcus sp.]|nr:NFACT family protein [Ruminococcus sp.]